jgi:hypothetical protein
MTPSSQLVPKHRKPPRRRQAQAPVVAHRWTVPPLLDKCHAEGLDPLGFVRFDVRLGWLLVAVPLRLLPHRGAAHMILTLFTNNVHAADVHDLRTRTIDGEPSWSFAVRPQLVPYLAAEIARQKAERR